MPAPGQPRDGGGGDLEPAHDPSASATPGGDTHSAVLRRKLLLLRNPRWFRRMLRINETLPPSLRVRNGDPALPLRR